MKLLNILRKMGIIHFGSGDSITGEYDSGIKNKKPERGDKQNKDKKPKKKISKIILFFYFIFGGFFLLAALGTSWGVFSLMFVFWSFLFFLIIKFSFSILIGVIILVVGAVMSFSFVGTSETNEVLTNDITSNTIDKQIEALEAETDAQYVSGEEIYIEAETGALSNGGEYSRIGESSRGGEVYLGDGNALVKYSFSLDTDGEYELLVNLNDDGVHPSGRRNATISVNGSSLKYNHISEDTGVWKWYELAPVSLQKGINEIVFTKDQTTSAAFIMDAFKLIPKK